MQKEFYGHQDHLDTATTFVDLASISYSLENNVNALLFSKEARKMIDRLRTNEEASEDQLSSLTKVIERIEV